MPFLSHIAAALFFALSGSGLLVGAGALAKCVPDVAKKIPSDERPPITAPDDGKKFKPPFWGELWRAEKERAVITRRCVIGSGAKGCAEICKAILAEDSCHCAKCDCQENKDRCEKFFDQHRTAPLPDDFFRTQKGMRELLRESQTRQTLHADSARIPFTPDGADRNRRRREWNGADFLRTTGGAEPDQAAKQDGYFLRRLRDDLDELDELDEAGEHSTE